ncbi:MAG: hypothetical protein JWR38_2078 [Mucilaginibacter sp.]|nr:hypothetical protein [Mucilaginibacter sp.]
MPRKLIIRPIFYVLIFLTFIGCIHQDKQRSKSIHTQKSTNAKPSDKNNKKIQYSDQQLEMFLDSTGKLPTQPLVDKTSFGADSVFKSQQQMDKPISPNDFNRLKLAIRSSKIDVKTAKSIFGNFEVDSTYVNEGILPVELFSFDKNKNEFNEYAICLGDHGRSWNDGLYFLKSNIIISKHNAYNRYGLDLTHYKDVDGKTVVYYKEGFDSGSGIWWNNFFFYKYDGNKLIPILNELENGNMQGFWGFRILWLESSIQKTNPLTIKMVYYDQLPDTSKADYGPRIVDDSTTVRYIWDERSKTLQGQYTQSKISKAQILSYYLNENDLLFINTYYKTLKSSLQDKAKRKGTLVYLNNVKNYYHKN